MMMMIETTVLTYIYTGPTLAAAQALPPRKWKLKCNSKNASSQEHCP
jgi:hypothetical protein